jgi:uncharacterized membrane protein (DUF4010 family)
MSFALTLKIVATIAVGLFIGLEREWAGKDAGVSAFALASLLGTIAWLVLPVLGFVQFSMVLLAVIIINVYSLQKEQKPEITTSFALVITNVLGMLIGSGNYLLPFACAIAVTALLSWKTELVTFSSKLTEAEIRGTLLLAFITAVVYPLLPDRTIDPWHILNPRAVWLTVMLVSGLKFVMYILLRHFGTRGIRYSALLGGLVNSAATSLLLSQEIQEDPSAETDITANFLLSDVAMILRNWLLVLIFVLPQSARLAIPTLVVLVPMMLVSTLMAGLAMLPVTKRTRQQSIQTTEQVTLKHARDRKDSIQQAIETARQESSREAQGQSGVQQASSAQGPGDISASQKKQKKPVLRSPLLLRSVLGFGLLFLFLTIFSGLAKMVFGSFGFLVVIVAGALASAASSSVLLGQALASGAVARSPAALAMLLATIVGLVENVVIFWSVTRKMRLSLRLLSFTLPVIAVGIIAFVLGHVFLPF